MPHAGSLILNHSRVHVLVADNEPRHRFIMPTGHEHRRCIIPTGSSSCQQQRRWRRRRRRRQGEQPSLLAPWRCSIRRVLLTLLFLSLSTTTLILPLLQSKYCVCDARQHSSTPKSNTKRNAVLKNARATSANRVKSAAGLVSSDGFSSAALEIDVRSKQGTRTTGVGSHSSRYRSIFAPQYSTKAMQKATVSALSGDMRPSDTADSTDRSDDGRAASYIQVKSSPTGLLFRTRINGNCSGVALTRSDPSSTVRSGTATLDQIPQIVSARFIDIDTVESTSKRRSSSDNADFSLEWIPIEGIYGIYSLPSGPHAVLITKSEETYTSPAPRPKTGSKADTKSPLLRFRRILSMEIVPVPYARKNNTAERSGITLSQRKSEERQLRLLRRSFREHDLYFVPPVRDVGDHDNVVSDITHNLQRSFLASSSVDHSNSKSEASSSDRYRRRGWWDSYNMNEAAVSSEHHVTNASLARPDSRFFWNEQHLKPLIGPHMSSIDASEGAGANQDCRYRSPYTLLLDCTFPVTSAFVGVQKRIVSSSTESRKVPKHSAHDVLYDEILISRRSKFRAGTRFTRRGADGTGAVTNYAETEQMCLVVGQDVGKSGGNEYLQEIYSHVQTRGSIPIRWSSPADVKTYRPRVLIGTDPIAQARALRNHLREQLNLYGIVSDKTLATNATAHDVTKQSIKLSFVNLIDKHSDQGRLGRAFDSILNAVLDVYSTDTDSSFSDDGSVTSSFDTALPSGGINHVWFDFHAECKGGRWDRLENLLRDLAPILDEQGYFCASSTSAAAPFSTNSHMGFHVLKVQDGVVRTNCMDCLDRTNVVQSIFGRYILHKQLHERLGLKGVETSSRKRTLPLEYVVAFRRNPMKLPWSSGEVSHRLLWADNADAISRLYAGTPALKGDFTRTGKRTKRGALDDGINSLQRYYLNNFIDADRQEGMDLLAGNDGFTLVDDDQNDQRELTGNGDTKDVLRNLLLFGPNNVRRSSSGRLEASKALRQRMRSSRSNGSISSTGAGANPLELDFNWLPGDLKGHMRSSAIFAEERRSELLKSIDMRSSSDLPWWAGDYPSDDEAQDNAAAPDATTSSSRVAPVENSIVPSRGHLLGTLVAASQAPVTTAACVVCILWPGLLSTTTKDDDDPGNE